MNLSAVKRVVAAVLGRGRRAQWRLYAGGGPRWYDSVPGLPHTGPFNPHFVADIGAAYLVASLALIARAWRPRYWPAAVAGAAFMVAHALIHVAGHRYRADAAIRVLMCFL